MLSRDDKWVDRLPWVPAMPGSKTYILEEAQKEIARLRQEIKRLTVENQELRAAITRIKERQGTDGDQKLPKVSSEHDATSPAAGDYLVVTGVIKILGHV